MDKRDFKYTILTLTKVLILMVICIGIPASILFYFINLIFNGGSVKNIFLDLVNTVGGLLLAVFLMFMFVYILIGIIYIFVKRKRRKDSLTTEVYVRDLPKYFPPAIVSFLLDLSVEATIDYTATIAYLVSKGYIRLGESEVKILNSNIENLSSHEKYVFNCLIKQNKFNHSEFVRLVLDDAEKMGLVQKGKRKVHFFRNFGLTLLVFWISSIGIQFFDSGIIYNIFALIGIISEIAIFGVIGYSLYLAVKYQNESFHRTSLGKQEALKWTGVKKFLNSFTIIDEKNLSDITLYDDYIPYAIALNEAKAVERYIENSDSYRILIYGNVYNLDK